MNNLDEFLRLVEFAAIAVWTYWITRKQLEPNTTLITIADRANESMRDLANSVADTTASATGVLMKTVEAQNEAISSQDKRLEQLFELLGTTDDGAAAERIANLAVKSIRDVHIVQATGQPPNIVDRPETSNNIHEEVESEYVPLKDV